MRLFEVCFNLVIPIKNQQKSTKGNSSLGKVRSPARPAFQTRRVIPLPMCRRIPIKVIPSTRMPVVNLRGPRHPVRLARSGAPESKVRFWGGGAHRLPSCSHPIVFIGPVTQFRNCNPVMRVRFRHNFFESSLLLVFSTFAFPPTVSCVESKGCFQD